MRYLLSNTYYFTSYGSVCQSSSINNGKYFMNLYSFLSEHFGKGTAFETPEGKTWTYSDIEQGSAKVANWIMSNNFPIGTVIAAQETKSVDNIILYLGVIRAGMVYFPLNPTYTSQEVDHFIQASGAAILLKNSKDRWKDMPDTFTTVDVDDSSPAVLLFTSGTTGSHKGALLTHKAMKENIIAFDKVLDWQPNDRLLHCLPVFHAHGLLIATHAMLYRGSSCIWMDSFNPKTCAQLLPKITIMMGVPTIYHRLSKYVTVESAKNVKAFISASAPLPFSVAEYFYQQAGKEIVERYGTTESLVITSNPISNVKRGTVGKPLPGVQIRLNSKDEIEIQSTSLFAGYLGNINHLSDDGWFNTGDQGKFDNEGYLTIFGRTKDIIIHNGFKVIPGEVEYVLEKCNGIDEVAVIGLPDTDSGERVCAVVVTKTDVNLNEVKEQVKQLAPFKQPKEILIVESLPRTPLGKIQKNKLRNDIADGVTQGHVYSL